MKNLTLGLLVLTCLTLKSQEKENQYMLEIRYSQGGMRIRKGSFLAISIGYFLFFISV